MNKNIRWLLFGTVLCLIMCIIGYIWWQHSRVLNVFDEMYTVESKSILDGSQQGFPEVEQVIQQGRNNAKYHMNEMPRSEVYKKEFLKENEDLSINFFLNTHQMNIVYSQKINKNITLVVYSKYFLKDKKLKQSIFFIDDGLNEFYVKKPNEIHKYLKRYRIDKKVLKKQVYEILYNTVIKDWAEHYDSRFSVDDIGKVKIEKDEFLK